MAHVTLEQIAKGGQDFDRAKLDATTEADIERHMREDGQDPEAEPVGYRWAPPLGSPRSDNTSASLHPPKGRKKAHA